MSCVLSSMVSRHFSAVVIHLPILFVLAGRSITLLSESCHNILLSFCFSKFFFLLRASYPPHMRDGIAMKLWVEWEQCWQLHISKAADFRFKHFWVSIIYLKAFRWLLIQSCMVSPLVCIYLGRWSYQYLWSFTSVKLKLNFVTEVKSSHSVTT